MVKNIFTSFLVKFFMRLKIFPLSIFKPPKTKGMIDRKSNLVNIFIYEKTYLFISLDPACNLIEKIFNCLLGVKKLNFLFNMTDFASVFIQENYHHFISENNEKVNFIKILFIFKGNSLLFNILYSTDKRSD